MQLSNTLLILGAELYAALIIVAVILWVYIKRLKSIVRRQQQKVLDVLRNPPAPVTQTPPPASPVSAPSLTPAQHYKAYLNKELEVTAAQFALSSPDADISSPLPPDAGSLQRILALRYAVLRTEELGTTEEAGTKAYWSIFQQALEPLLPQAQIITQDHSAELETANKRIENLEKFKKLFFDMEQQWGSAQATAQDYYNQLLALSQNMENSDQFGDLLNKYHGSFDDIHRLIINTVENPSNPSEHKVINITRHDPRAAEEITKLRNVAADQHRIINQLQRKLFDAKTSEEKELVIQELEQQLLRQTRFVQESETCVQLLEEELERIHEELAQRESAVDEKNILDEENHMIKNALHSFTLESKDLISNINQLEKENQALKQGLTLNNSATNTKEMLGDAKQIQAELLDLKKQYAELEEKYLDLKLSK